SSRSRPASQPSGTVRWSEGSGAPPAVPEPSASAGPVSPSQGAAPGAPGAARSPSPSVPRRRRSLRPSGHRTASASSGPGRTVTGPRVTGSEPVGSRSRPIRRLTRVDLPRLNSPTTATRNTGLARSTARASRASRICSWPCRPASRRASRSQPGTAVTTSGPAGGGTGRGSAGPASGRRVVLTESRLLGVGGVGGGGGGAAQGEDLLAAATGRRGGFLGRGDRGGQLVQLPVVGGGEPVDLLAPGGV